jgi:hypothetical protein
LRKKVKKREMHKVENAIKRKIDEERVRGGKEREEERQLRGENIERKRERERERGNINSSTA